MPRLRLGLGLGAATPNNSEIVVPRRQVLGNGNVAPSNFATSQTTRYLHVRKKRKVAQGSANWSSVQMVFRNFVANSVAETTNYPTLVFKASILYNGVYYPAQFGGEPDVVVAGGVKVTGNVDDLTLPAGVEFEECLRLTYPLLFKTQSVNFTVGETVTGATSGATGVIVSQTDTGTAGSLVLSAETGAFIADEVLTGSLGGAAVVDLTTAQNRIWGAATQAAFLEGLKTTNNSSIDYTNSSPVVYPVYTANLSGGNIASVTRVSAGSGYAGGCNLIAYEMQSDGTLAIKTIGYGNPSGGGITSGTVTSGTPPAGASWTNPKVVMSGGDGFGVVAATPCCALITGIPDVPMKSLLLVGDSIARGFTSTDSVGDDLYNYGVYERAIDSRIPVANMSVSGGSANYFSSYASIYPLLFDLYMGSATHALITLGTNDIMAGASKATVQGGVNNIAAYLRTFDTEVSFSTLMPRTTGTFSTLAGQTPVSGFGSGGVANAYNDDLLNGVLSVDWPVVNSRPLYQDSVETNKWRIDAGSITTDGTHPSFLGLGLGATDATFRGFFDILEE